MNDAVKGLKFFGRFAYSFSNLGYRQRRLGWSDPGYNFHDQRWLVSGASGGIGRAIAMGAAEHGAEVLALARSEEKLSRLAAATDGRIVTQTVDLSLTSELVRYLDDLSGATDGVPIDVLVNNVGVLSNDHQLNEEGSETSFATNLLNHYILTEGLVRRGLLADDAVVINMSSGGMYNVPLQLKCLDVQDPAQYDGVKAYAYQKRAQVELNAWWRDLYADRGWHFYVMHPGWVDTQGVRSSLPGFRALFKHVLRDAAAGADTALWLATARPAQKQNESIWFDRDERPAHLGRSTRRNADDAEQLVDFLRNRAAKCGYKEPI
jgi:dehydrogenase/reductase SDR family protein 12